MSAAPRVSFVIATHNRRDTLAQTLERIAGCGLAAGEFETIVVDNDSTDGTPEMLRAVPGVRAIALRRNRGPCAKALALPHTRGEFTVFLDDDSFPRAGCIERMLEHFAADERLAAAGFLAFLPDGAQECSALPHVFIGCGVGFRTRALREVGSLDTSFFMAAEEYDLAFRLLGAGWRCETFADLAVDHLKSLQARASQRILRLDARNNMRLIARYLAPPASAIYAADWRQRYSWLAQAAGRPFAFVRGWCEGLLRGALERGRYRGQRLAPAAFESVFRWEFVAARMRRLHDAGVRRITLIDLGKNIYPYVRAARESGVRINCIGDDRFARPGRSYRGIEIVPLARALRAPGDALVISNMSFVHAAARQAQLSSPGQLAGRKQLDLPVRAPLFNWFPPPSATAEQAPDALRPHRDCKGADFVALSEPRP